MMRIIVVICFLVSSLGTQAQLIIKGINDVQENATSRTSSITAAPLAVPFWDDFSGNISRPDTSLWETGTDIFVNKTLAINAPTQGIATFDGLQANGQAHNISSNFNGNGDSLVSKPIDLTTINSFDRNSVYLSFFWQALGAGEIPDDDDSIRLQLLAKVDANLVWETRWVQRGGLESVSNRFKFEDVQINQPRYFHKDFKIKFESFSNLTGPFDTWNIDYVYLNQYRSNNDSTFIDRSPSGTPGPLFGDYYQITSEAFFIDPAAAISQQSILISNLNNDVQPSDVSYILRNENTKEEYLNFPITNVGLILPGEIKPAIGPDPSQVTLNVPSFDEDSLVLSSTFLYDTGDSLLYEIDSENNAVGYDINLRRNDTLTSYYTLHNYYSYDDGSAEFAVGVNTNRGQIAMQYILVEPDTMTHIDVYFPNISPSSAGKSIELRVWGKSLNDNGILSRASHLINLPEKPNSFTRISLNVPVILEDTFHIGYQQFIDNYIGIGFDRNNQNGSDHIFSNVEGVWDQNDRLSGSIMIRPVFDDPGVIVLSSKDPMPSEIKVFPNPTSGIFTIQGSFNEYQIFNLMGQVVFHSETERNPDLQFLPDGLYLLKIRSENTIATRKLMIRK